MEQLSFEMLKAAVAGEHTAIRAVTRLQPAGGPGDKVFPPTYANDEKSRTKYAMENRRIDGREVPVVLLDSVASQANRMEEALQDAWDAEELRFPVIWVDFSKEEGISDLDRITTLQAPHRIADALLRDSVLYNTSTPFRQSPVGRAITDATPANATPLFHYCPTALIFGMWDSTGPKGGLGSKFQRALVSEIVGVGALVGAKTASRLDPARIESSVKVYHRADDHHEWTTDEAEAMKKGGKPVPFSRRAAEGKGNPSAVNHSNVAPSIDETAGGVTFDYAVQTTVLSLSALRRLRFAGNSLGQRVPASERSKAEPAARAALAALGLAAIVASRRNGYDLRSRSLLVPEGPLVFELIPADGGEARRCGLSWEGARELVQHASEAAAEAGLKWSREPLSLQPAPKLSELIRKSRALSAAGGDDEDGED